MEDPYLISRRSFRASRSKLLMSARPLKRLFGISPMLKRILVAARRS